MEYIEKREYHNISFWRIEDDIVQFKYAPKIEINLEEARELVGNRLDFTGGQPIYALIDFTNVKSVTKEARDFMNSPEGGLKGISGGAFLSNNVVATMFVNLYLKVSTPPVPAKFFNSQREALDWLKKIRTERKQLSPV